MENQEKSYIFEQQIKKLIIQNAFLSQLLHDLKMFEPLGYLSAGVIRNWIWSHLHGQNYDFHQTEIDVVFYDAEEINQQRTLRLKSLLEAKYPDQIWDITNQAHVHHWYKTENGDSISPLHSIDEALSYWPETATAIAVRMDEQHQIEVIVPFGLNDLFELKLCWNGRLVSRGVFAQRVKTKRFLERWSQLEIVN